ncbi:MULTISPECIES: hypothetical protein [unclassified Moraxella]|uniref:hypothetical protein n=1 Tax=unclassified Moraxella TaxID=2685852 RepID=UPI003AF96151
MLTIANQSTLFQDRYQALIMPVPVSGIFRHRLLLRFQSLYPEQYAQYKQICERSELALGEILVLDVQQDLIGMGVGRAVSKPKFIVMMAVTTVSESSPHLSAIQGCFQALEPLLMRWGRYDGIRRVALLGSDDLIIPTDLSFDGAILPMVEKYLQPISRLNVVLYR